MEKTVSIIKKNIDKHSHFEEYFKTINIIEEHELVNPDICIESCKSLIEGISKTIIITLDNTKTPENVDKDDLPKLFKEAMRVLINNCSDIEGDFVSRFSNVIQVLGEIRNKRGDISHGRMAPKVIYSSKKFATTIKNMTDSILEYILEHYFDLDFSIKEKLEYNDSAMEAYNIWLDDSVDFPIAKARYSQILFEHDRDEYESRYNDEYLKSLEENKIEVGIKVEIEELEKTEIPSFSEIILKTAQEPPKLSSEESKKLYEAHFGKKEELKPVVQLVNTFDEKTFWTSTREVRLNQFSEDSNIQKEKIKQLIEDYIFYEQPLDLLDINNVLNVKLSIFKNSDKLDELRVKITDLITELKKS